MALSQQTFVIACGVPASGKTTWVRDFCAAHPEALLVSSDDRIERLAAAEGASYQDAYVRHNKAVLAAIFEDARAALAQGRSVVWDQTNLTPQARAERLALAPPGVLLVAAAFEVEPGEQAARLADREAATGKSIPDFVLAKQRADYARPSEGEGFHIVLVNPPAPSLAPPAPGMSPR